MRFFPILLSTFFLACTHAQIPDALDVTCSISLRDADGSVLQGNNPLLPSGHIPGGQVQLVDVGGNGKIDFPQADGEPGGDDQLISRSSIGAGMLGALSNSGRFTFSVIPTPVSGTRVYVRVFNQGDAALATRWGQSAVFTVGDHAVLDVGQLSLHQTIMSAGTDAATTDSDNDGVMDKDELIANTNAQVADGNFSVVRLNEDHSVNVDGSAGRDYALLRSLALNPPVWEEVARSGVLASDQSIALQDPSPAQNQAYYILTVSFPDLN